MKKFILVLLFVNGVSRLHAQNLVPNPDFESVTTSFTCGIFSATDLASSVNGWYSPTGATPDAYSTAIAQSCYNFMPNSTYSGPVSLKGPQMPRSGSVMAGVYCYTIPGLNQREYIQVQLASPMEVNETYAVSFYANLPNRHERYTDRLGAYLSVGAISGSNDQPLPYVPQVAASGFITDTLNWILITDTFLVTSAYDYVTIGNFYGDANTTTGNNPGGTSNPGNYGAYYFIDDVSVIKITPKGIGQLVSGLSMLEVVSVNGNTTVLLTNENTGDSKLEIEVFDIRGRSVFRKEFEITPGLNRLEITGITASGAYLLAARTEEQIFTRKFVRAD